MWYYISDIWSEIITLTSMTAVTLSFICRIIRPKRNLSEININDLVMSRPIYFSINLLVRTTAPLGVMRDSVSLPDFRASAHLLRV